ncbi:hypothetical protein ACFL0T_07615 [Candidatus Omnitrophota bacterium]
MEKKTTVEKKVKMACGTKASNEACGGIAYFLGIIGASVYYISTAPGFWAGVLGF